jgi:hypothetical protein
VRYFLSSLWFVCFAVVAEGANVTNQISIATNTFVYICQTNAPDLLEPDDDLVVNRNECVGVVINNHGSRTFVGQVLRHEFPCEIVIRDSSGAKMQLKPNSRVSPLTPARILEDRHKLLAFGVPANGILIIDWIAPDSICALESSKPYTLDCRFRIWDSRQGLFYWTYSKTFRTRFRIRDEK